MGRLQAALGVAVAAATLAGSARSAGIPQVTVETIPKVGITLQVPSAWTGETAPAAYRSLGVVYVFLSNQTSSGFRANLNLIVSPLQPRETLHQWLFQGASSSLEHLGTTTTVTIGGQAGIHYESTRAEKAGSLPLLTDEYAFARNGKVYLFTYTSLARDRATYDPVFAVSAETIRFPAGSTA